MLCDRHGDSCDINLLKAVLADQVHAGVPRYGDQWDRVGLRCGECGDEVCRAGAGRCEHNACFPGYARISVGGVRRPLLMCAADRADAVAAGIQLVINGQDSPARIAKYGVDIVLLQYFEDDPCARVLHITTFQFNGIILQENEKVKSSKKEPEKGGTGSFLCCKAFASR